MDVLYWLDQYQERLKDFQKKEGRTPSEKEKGDIYDDICVLAIETEESNRFFEEEEVV